MKAIKVLVTGFILSSVLFGYTEIVGASESAPAGITRSNSGGGVTVNVTYPHSQNTDETRFEVVLDTHAVNLDAYDLKTLSLLRDDTGKTYQPVRVENKGSGHHREIAVVFPKVSAPAKRLELVIKDVAGIKERSFLWDLQ
ncbi:MAG TPA: hypothetical protein VGL70_11800 [Candidatus Binatia bacterium]|jgi:hypothetical protein